MGPYHSIVELKMNAGTTNALVPLIIKHPKLS